METTGVDPVAMETDLDSVVAVETVHLTSVAKENKNRELDPSSVRSESDNNPLQPLITMRNVSQSSDTYVANDYPKESKTAACEDGTDTGQTAVTEDCHDAFSRLSSPELAMKATVETHERDSKLDETKLLPFDNQGHGHRNRFQSEPESDENSAVLKVEAEDVSAHSPGRSVKARCLTCKCDASFVKNPLYVTALLSAVLCLGLSICFVFLVLDFATNRGWTVQDGITLNFAFMLSSLIGRAVLGVVSLHKGVNCVVLLGGSGLVGGVGVCLIGQVSTRGFCT